MITDVLPAHTSFISATPSLGACSEAAGILTCKSTTTVPFSEMAPGDVSILLVDADDNSPNVQGYYAATLDALGYDFTIFEVGAGSGDQAGRQHDVGL